MSSYQPYDQFDQSQYASPPHSDDEHSDEDDDLDTMPPLEEGSDDDIFSSSSSSSVSDRLRISDLENQALVIEIEDLQKELQCEKRKYQELADDYEFHIRESGREVMLLRNELMRLRHMC